MLQASCLGLWIAFVSVHPNFLPAAFNVLPVGFELVRVEPCALRFAFLGVLLIGSQTDLILAQLVWGEEGSKLRPEYDGLKSKVRPTGVEKGVEACPLRAITRAKHSLRRRQTAIASNGLQEPPPPVTDFFTGTLVAIDQCGSQVGRA